ncbi:MAG: Glycosyl transferase family 39 [Candidatus Curtissbacteria bacterium GW2011_GWA1_41_11]|uniref:Polyprenol-phosphate-mannose--protein mannosyltransferase n=1 Tax=Candidatus Curtissbacteria bacterium GW2011_GWA1_41_11 TaxID=1618409 RepID=A0A0G0UFM5_9BACT|nr:MAG: Glycosyl transferase family 39 [Candidatus Curtissbacteria bacterium GW2011_GWA1_41_11]
MSKKLIIFIVLLTFFSLIIRVYRLSEPNHYYFDEVYHVVTARAYANNDPAAYNPFSPPPEEGTAFDWLHPPLAKLIQAASIKVIGDKPIGWRLPSAIFGTALIPATFALAYLLFGPAVAVFASLIIAFENLTFVMSRITMNDIFLAFFVVCSFIFAYLYATRRPVKNLLITAVFLGLALATKWTGFYAIVAVLGFLLLHDLKERRLNLKLILLVIIPLLMYLGSYGQYFLQGHSVSEFVGLHKQIWWYQNRHDLEHSYGTTAFFCVPQGTTGPKSWCPWVLNIRGVYFSYKDYGSDNAGYIYALGNPIVFWLGIVAVSYMIGKFIQRRSMKILLVLLAYFIFWLPWIFTPRLLFLYHYLPSIPFLAIVLGYEFRDIYNTRFKFAVILLLVVIALTFLYFFPISSGWPIKIDSIDRFMWLRSWR